MDSIVTFIIIVVASGVIALLKNKGMIKGLEDQRPDQPEKPASTPAPRRPMATPTQAPRPAATSWEAELRRLLEGDKPPAPPPPIPRPVVVAQPPTSTPPVVRPVVVKPVIVRSAPAVIPRAVPVQVPAAAESSVELSAGEMAPMRESKRAYDMASQLDRAVAAHIDKVPGQRVLATGVIRRPASAEVAQVVSMFKNPRAARQAVIASIIFSPPKGLEQAPGIF